MITLARWRSAVWLLALVVSIVACVASLEEYPIIIPGAVHKLHAPHFRVVASIVLAMVFFVVSMLCGYKMLREVTNESRPVAGLGAGLIAILGVLSRFIILFGYDELFHYATREGFR